MVVRRVIVLSYCGDPEFNARSHRNRVGYSDYTPLAWDVNQGQILANMMETVRFCKRLG
jgi:hypothetical protein